MTTKNEKKEVKFINNLSGGLSRSEFQQEIIKTYKFKAYSPDEKRLWGKYMEKIQEKLKETNDKIPDSKPKSTGKKISKNPWIPYSVYKTYTPEQKKAQQEKIQKWREQQQDSDGKEQDSVTIEEVSVSAQEKPQDINLLVKDYLNSCSKANATGLITVVNTIIRERNSKGDWE